MARNNYSKIQNKNTNNLTTETSNSRYCVAPMAHSCNFFLLKSITDDTDDCSTLQMPVRFVCKAVKKQLIIIIFDCTCICYFQSHPYQQERLAHTAQLPVSHRTDVWSFCWRHQSDQRHICLSDCKCAIASFLPGSFYTVCMFWSVMMA